VLWVVDVELDLELGVGDGLVDDGVADNFHFERFSRSCGASVVVLLVLRAIAMCVLLVVVVAENMCALLERGKRKRRGGD
jgi:hypothetical protein